MRWWGRCATWWTREQARRFLAVAKESHCGPIWLLMGTTGMRRGEALGLRWASVDLDAGVIDIRQTLVAIDGRMKIARVGVPEIPIHSVRHTVGTLLVASGEDVRTVAEVLGHDPRVLLRTYAHVMAHRKAEVVNTISGLVLREE